MVFFFQLVFEGVRGSGYQGDIAIDDISMDVGACQGVATCDFETDLCGWTERQDDVFDWTLNRGTTPSSNTGPSVDHTLGTTTGQWSVLAHGLLFEQDILDP